jgi:hypothetical protein
VIRRVFFARTGTLLSTENPTFSPHDGGNRFETRLGTRRKCLVEAFPAKTGRHRDLRHAARFGYVTQRLEQYAGVFVADCERKIFRNRFVTIEIVSDLKWCIGDLYLGFGLLHRPFSCRHCRIAWLRVRRNNIDALRRSVNQFGGIRLRYSYCIITGSIPHPRMSANCAHSGGACASKRLEGWSPEIGTGASWFETAQARLLTMRV